MGIIPKILINQLIMLEQDDFIQLDMLISLRFDSSGKDVKGLCEMS